MYHTWNRLRSGGHRANECEKWLRFAGLIATLQRGKNLPKNCSQSSIRFILCMECIYGVLRYLSAILTTTRDEKRIVRKYKEFQGCLNYFFCSSRIHVFLSILNGFPFCFAVSFKNKTL